MQIPKPSEDDKEFFRVASRLTRPSRPSCMFGNLAPSAARQHVRRAVRLPRLSFSVHDAASQEWPLDRGRAPRAVRYSWAVT